MAEGMQKFGIIAVCAVIGVGWAFITKNYDVAIGSQLWARSQVG